jgi:hypothetical protein
MDAMRANGVPRPSDADRCTRIKKSGERCGNWALAGVTVCKYHGGTLPSVRAKSEVFKAQRETEKHAPRAISHDDPEGRGDLALGMEIRRTVGWIRYCEAQIALLGAPRAGESAQEAADEDVSDVLGGLQLAEQETQHGTERGEETALSREKWTSGVNVWEEKLRWNRHHLAALTKQWINAGFEAKRLEIQGRTLDVLEKAIDGIVRDLGRNPRDAEVRAIVRKRLEQAATEKPGSEQAL